MSRGTPGDNYNLKTAAIAAHDASYVLYRTGILSSGYATDASNVNFYNLTLNNKLHVKGDFQVDGSMTEIYSSRLDISDGLIELATSNASDSIDIGFYGQYNDGSDKYTGLFRDRTGKSYQLFNNCSSRPNQAGVTAGSYEYANLALNDISLSTINGEQNGALAISKSGVMTTVNGTLNVKQAVTLDETLTVAADKTTQLGGNVTIKGDIDTVAAGAMTLGGSTATSIDIADAGVITTVKGTLNVDQAVTLDETLTVAADKTTQLGGNVTIKGDIDTVAAGAMTLGGSTATSIDIADAGVITTVKGTLNVDQAVTLDETLTVAADKTTQLGGNVTIKGDIDTVAAGAMTLGGSTATSIDIADAGVITTVKGTLNVDQAVTLDSTLAVSGTITATDDITAFFDSSDRRLKKNVETIDSALSIINNLRGVRFDWNEEAQKLNENVDLNKRELGVIAQEIEKELPEVIKEGLGGYMAVRYEKITPLLIQCIKEQQTMIKQQDERISKLENSQN